MPGEGADLVNAGVSAIRGNTGEALVDLGGALGPAGSAIAGANRFRKIAKAVSKAEDVAGVGTGVSKGITARKLSNLAKADARVSQQVSWMGAGSLE